MLRLYAKLGVSVDGRMLLEQMGVTVSDHVNEKCRITVESAYPESGPEFDGRAMLGKIVRVGVHVLHGHRVGDALPPAILEMDAKVIAAEVKQAPEGTIVMVRGEPKKLPGGIAMLSFTAERWEQDTES